MATQVIPLDSTYDHFVFTVELDGTTYTCEFKFNARDNTWCFDFSDELENLIVGSIPTVIGWPLLRQYQYKNNVPKGLLYFVDTSGFDVRPGRFDLGNRVIMVYEEAASA